VLIDVRTRAELAFVGVADLSSIGRPLIAVEWSSFPSNSVDPAFPDHVRRELASVGAGHETDLFFICRSGARSQQAAMTMASAGYRSCCNVRDGFEGPLDAHRRRGTTAGWKAAGLPWVQA
jgi:rhodanese-related sulfurtransferase